MRQINWGQRVLVAAIAWFILGPRILEQWAAGPATATSVADKTLKKLAQTDAQAAAQLAQLHARNAAAQAVTLAQAEAQGLSALRQLAAEVAAGRVPASAQLAELAVRPGAFPTPADRDAFLANHATVAQALLDHPDALTGYLADLRRLADDPAIWPVIRDDAVAVFVHQQVSDANLRAYYLAEREWLAELCVTTQAPEAAATHLQQVLTSAQRYHTLVRSAVVDEKLGALGLLLFLEHGPAIQAAVNDHGVPLGEVLEVVFANSADAGAITAERLRDLYTKHRAVWNVARHQPHTLKLLQLVPDVAPVVLDKFAADNITGFLFAHYPEQLTPAVRALAQSGDLGLFVLNKYADDPPRRLHKLLAQHGPRVVPYLAKVGDEGFDQINSNPKWLDRYFAADGTPWRDDWWSVLPGGAAGQVVKNRLSGTPSTWGELGWAAVDTADGVLLALTLGGSSGLTVLKQSGKSAVQTVTRTEAIAVQRQLAVAEAKVASATARTEAQAAVRTGTRSLLRTTLSALARGTQATAYTLRLAGRAVTSAGLRIASTARSLVTGWTRVSPLVRQWTYRGLLAVGLAATLTYRTLPEAERVADGVARLVTETLHGVSQHLSAQLGEAFEQLSQPAWAAPRGWWLLYVAPLVGAAAWVLWPQRRLADA
jgi:hypothetical protein